MNASANASLQAPLFAAVLCLGSGAFFLALAVALRSGRRELKAFLLLFSSLALLVASNFALFSLAAARDPGGRAAMRVLMAANKFLSALSFLSIALVAQSLLDVPWKAAGGALASAAAAMAALASVMGTFRVDPLAPVGLFLALYGLVLLLRFRRRIAGAAAKAVLRRFFVLTAIFMPGFAYDLFSGSGVAGIPSLPLLLPIFAYYFAALSLGVIREALRALLRSEASIDAAARSGAAARSEGRELALDSLAEKTALSPREKEIARLVAKGLGNKQIAAALGISDRTVGNHIYAMFRKIGISSRFELLGILQG
ncbi:MAG: hypothetical protein JNG85_03805 [Spirochaetaceae bacterium]|nr:hypothetical protein [Spirochaetaceae bacterium]